MPRQIPLNYIRMLRNDAGVTALTVTYIVGTYSVRNGFTTNIDLPEETKGGVVVVPIAQTDTEAMIQQNLVTALCTEEGMDPGQGDRVYGTDGTQLI